jgi:glycosyltransferase involved in cell wall biosynthesis
MLEERWHSMDLVTEMLHGHLDPARVDAFLLRPPLRLRLSRIAGVNGRLLTSDRIINRFWDYPRWLRGHRDGADVFHVIDHSYAYVTRELPVGRIVVTCHDTDAFRPLRDGTPRESRLPHFFVRRIVQGIRRAAVVACDSEVTRRELVEWDIVPRERTEVVPIGVDGMFSAGADPEGDAAAAALLGPDRHVDLLHVGSTIPRKRIDVLLHTIRRVADDVPEVRLIRVGGPFTPPQRRLVTSLGIADRVLTLPFLDRRVLAAVYRRSALALLPSEREGFGLPLIEAMASGTPVVATSLEVLREVGGTAAVYAPLGDAAAWRDCVVSLLSERSSDAVAWAARRDSCLQRAARYSWQQYAGAMADIYERVAGAATSGSTGSPR